MTTSLGAEVTGVDLGQLGDEQAKELGDALDEHLVLVFRDQDVSPDGLVRVGAALGAVTPAPFGPKLPGHPDVTLLDQVTPRGEGGDAWHADNTYMLEPPRGAVLQAVQLPPVGGDTCFANMVLAYERLSGPMRQFLDQLWAVHNVENMLTKVVVEDRKSDDDTAAVRRTQRPVLHPVVRQDVDRGRRGLFVSRNWVTRIAGLDPRESSMLLEFLFDRAREPDGQLRVHWEPGTIVVWDNRWVQHYAVPDYHERRVMHRVTIGGTRPVATDGRSSCYLDEHPSFADAATGRTRGGRNG